jgi:hypothetical protein
MEIRPSASCCRSGVFHFNSQVAQVFQGGTRQGLRFFDARTLRVLLQHEFAWTLSISALLRSTQSSILPLTEAETLPALVFCGESPVAWLEASKCASKRIAQTRIGMECARGSWFRPQEMPRS